MLANREKSKTKADKKVKTSGKQRQEDYKTINEKQDKSKTGGLLKNLRLSFRSKKGNKKKQQRELFNTEFNQEGETDPEKEKADNQSFQQRENHHQDFTKQELNQLEEGDDQVFQTNAERQKLAYFQALKSIPVEYEYNLKKAGYELESSTITSVNSSLVYHYQAEEPNYAEIEDSRNFQSEDIFRTNNCEENISRDIMGFLRRKSSNSSNKDKQLKHNDSDANSQGTRSRSNSSESAKRKW